MAVVPDDMERRLVSCDMSGDDLDAEMVVVTDKPCFCSAQGATGTMLGSPWTSGP